MGLFNKHTPDTNENKNLIDEIYGNLTEQEISEIEKAADREEAFEIMRRRVQRRHRLRVTGVSLLLFSLTLAVVFAGYKFLFVISEVEVSGESPYSADEIREAAGIIDGDGLYSFSSADAEDRLIKALPYISELDVDRHIPDRITLNVKCEKAVYYTEIYGKIYLMSDSLRILGESSETDLSGLIWLRFSEVKEAELGYPPVLRDSKAQKNLVGITNTVNSSVMNGRVVQIDMRDPYDLRMVADGKYLLEFGEYTEIDTKLRIAEAVLKDEMFDNDNKARLDLSKLSETAVIVNNKLDFTK